MKRGCHLSGLGPRAGCGHAWLCPQCRAPPSSPELLVGLPWKNVLGNDDLGQGLFKKLQGGDSGMDGTRYKTALPKVEASSRDRLGLASSSRFTEPPLCSRFHAKC